MTTRIATTALLALALAATGLAGCLGDKPTTEDQEFSVSRVFTINLDRETAQEIDDESVADAIDDLVETSLVVRVAAPGAYTLVYTDEDGREKTAALVDLQPGRPHEVRGADALTFATLKDVTGKVVAERKSISVDWWRAGDVPLGFAADAPSRGVYDYALDSTASVSLSDVDAEDGNGHLDSLVASIGLPIDGELKWDLVDDGSEDRLDLSALFEVDDSRGSLASFEATGTVEGKSGTIGGELLSGNARLEGALTLWLRDGRLTAGQFQRGAVHYAPEAVMWAHGEAFEGSGVPCEGKTRADRCQVEDLPSVDETMGPEPKEAFDDEDMRIDPSDEPARIALEFLEKLLAQDLQVHDQLTFTATATNEDFGTTSDATIRFTYELLVPARERVTVPAGAYDALKIVQTARIFADVDEITTESCVEYGETTYRSDEPAPAPTPTPEPYPYPTTPYPTYPAYPTPTHTYPTSYGCQRTETRTIVEDLHLDETLARTTIWLEAGSFQPLRISVESPLDVDAALTKLFGAAGDGFWADSPVDGIDPQKLDLRATATTEVVARELTGDARFAPYVGLFVATTLANGAGTFSGLPGMFMTRGYAQPATEVAYPTAEPGHLSLASSAPLEDGSKSYVISSASRMAWYDLAITVDGVHLWQDTGSCDAGADGSFTVCGDGQVRYGYEPVMAGDELTLHGVEAGQTLRIIDNRSNSVMISLVVS